MSEVTYPGPADWWVQFGHVDTGFIVDARHLLGSPRYDTAIPGGYTTASLILTVPWRQLQGVLRELDDVTIGYGPTTCWEGQVEEIIRADQAAETTTVTCLGTSSALLGPRLRRVWRTSDYGGWRPAAERGTGYTQSTVPQFASPTLAGADGACLQVTLPNGQAVATTDDYQVVWEAPPDCYITHVTFKYRTSGASASWVVMADDSLPSSASGWAETVKASASIASASGTVDYTMVGTTRRVLMVAVDVTAAHKPAADEYVRLFDVAVYCANHPDGGPFTSASVEPVTVIRDVLTTWVPDIDARPSVTPGYAFTTLDELAFTTPVSPQTVLEHITGVTGVEWAVWSGGRLHLRTLADMHAHDSPSGVDGLPAWWLTLTSSDGAVIDLRPSLDKLVNQVIVTYQSSSGVAQSVTMDRFGDPYNPLNSPAGGRPRRIRCEVVSLPGTQSDTQAQEAATAYLDAYGRAVVQGTIRVPAGLRVNSRQSPRGAAPEFAAGVLAGMWVEVPELRGLVGDAAAGTPISGRPPDLFPIRSTSVDPVTSEAVFTIDSTPNTFTALLARLQQASG